MADTPSPVELSIVIASYRCRDLLDACLSSLPHDVQAMRTQVIVVDNDSADGTVEMVADRHPWVDLIPAGANVGFARATNIGLSHARGRFVLLLNPDTVVPPGALDAAVAELERNTDVGMLGVKLVTPDGTIDHACKRGFPTPLSSLYHFLGLTRAFPHSATFSRYTAGAVGEDDVSTVDAINGAFMLVRREAAVDVGLLDEDYWMYGEDLDWCFRFWNAGWKILYWPRVEVLHVKGGSSGRRRSLHTNAAFHRAMWTFYTKHYRPTRNPFVTAAVGVGILARFLFTTGANTSARALGLQG